MLRQSGRRWCPRCFVFNGRIMPRVGSLTFVCLLCCATANAIAAPAAEERERTGATAGACPSFVQVITLVSGQVNGSPGAPCQTDTEIGYATAGPSSTCFNGSLGPALPFAQAASAALSVPHAQIIAPVAGFWVPGLNCNPDARWINFASNGSCLGIPAHSTLYAQPFDVAAGSVCEATIEFCWAVDDALGDPGGPAPFGVFIGDASGLNVTAVPGLGFDFAGGSFSAETCVTATLPSGAVVPGQNFLYVYQRDTACAASGIIYCATITVCACDCPCNDVAPGNCVIEAEPCGTDSDGGCNSSPPAFQPIVCGDTVCGDLWALGGIRDTDWYSFTISKPSVVRWEVCADIAVAAFILDATTCTSPALEAIGAAWCPAVAEATLCPGTYWAFVAPAVFDGVPCQELYVASLTCTPVSPGPPWICCGEPQMGSCFAVHPTPYCDDPICCNNVCSADPSCCTIAWDSNCVFLAITSPECAAGDLVCPGGDPPSVFVCEAGCRDEFSVADGTEAASGSPPCSPFDELPTDGCFEHVFSGCWPSCPAGCGPNSCGTILAAFLEIRTKQGQSDANPFDSIHFTDQGTIIGSGVVLGLSTTLFDLGNLPVSGSILSTLCDGELGVIVEDDSAVDYLSLTVIHCPCKAPFRPEIKLDEPGTFSTPSATTPSADLLALATCSSGALTSYDVPAINQCFVETIDVSAYPCMFGGHLEIGVVPTSWPNNDTLSLELKGDFECGPTALSWGQSLANLQAAGVVAPPFATGQLSIITLALDNLPPSSSGVRNIVGRQLDGMLDIFIQDDTGVSFISYFPLVCPCPPSDCCDRFGAFIDPSCAALVCAADPFCCDLFCDKNCKLLAEELCNCKEVPGLAADLNGDGAVDGADLGLLLANWDGSGLGDINGNGVVDGADLGLLLAGWSGSR